MTLLCHGSNFKAVGITHCKKKEAICSNTAVRKTLKQ